MATADMPLAGIPVKPEIGTRVNMFGGDGITRLAAAINAGLACWQFANSAPEASGIRDVD